jgi:hypothetical protein
LRMLQFTILLLLLGRAHAETPGEAQPAPTFAPVSVQLVSLPATPEAHTGPERQRVVDKKFVIVMGALGLAEAMHSTTRTLVLEHEQAAGAPWVTSLPSHPGLIATNAAIFASEVLVAYEMKKRHDWLPGDRIIRKLWWMYPAVMAVPHVKSAVHNIRLQPPAGCTSRDCQSP